MRRGQMNRDWRAGWGRVKAKLAQAPGLAIASVFIGVSGLMSVTFGYRLGEPSDNALIFAAVALAIEGYADLAVPLFWHRLGVIGRVVLIAFFGLCLAYKLEAAKRFTAENLGKRDAAASAASESYSLAKENVERLRKIVANNAEVRAVAIIQAEIDELLRTPGADGCPAGAEWNGPVTKKVCPKVDRLRGEHARAEARDKAQADLTPAITALRTTPAPAIAAQESTGPVAWALAALGVQVGGWSQLIASLIMAIVEGGAIILPMLIGAASRAGARMVATGAAPTPQAAQVAQPPAPTAGANNPPASPAPLPPGVTDRTRRDILELRAFLLDQVEPSQGERVQSASLYLIYTTWKKDTSRRGFKPGEEPMTIVQFGKLLSLPIGLQKKKIEGRQYYLNIRLRHPAQGRKGVGQARAAAA
jgi:hypothetical protein